MRKIFRGLGLLIWWLKQIIISSLILGLLFYIVFSFYIISSLISLQAFLYVFLTISILTDGILIFIHLPRRSAKRNQVSFDPAKLTIVISCYNGEDIIGETIAQAKLHVPANQIIVVSDASTDKTAEVAAKAGVHVLVNRRNVNKAFSVTRAVQHVKTPYVLVLDDDTLIGKTFIPTSLLDEGYSAVAFNVMPVPEGTVLNHMQRFEYRKSMELSKSLRSRVGAVGNVSGAIGLFHTKDLRQQMSLHSGQFGGEDEQRTTLVHLYSEGRGIIYSDSTVLTAAPDTWQKLMKQRSFKWNLSVPELFVLYFRILLSPNHHYLLKSEKAYQLYIYLTDPLRILFFWILFVRPVSALIAYVFYLALSLVVWARTRFKDPWWTVVLFPPYSLLVSVCRFVAYFYWIKLKFRYLFKDRFHRVAINRKLKTEYALVFAVILVFWVTALYHFNSDIQLWNRVRSTRLDDNSQQFSYDVSAQSLPNSLSTDNIQLSITPVDSILSIAHRSIDVVLTENPGLHLPASNRTAADNQLAEQLQKDGLELSNSTVQVPSSTVKEVIASYQIGGD